MAVLIQFLATVARKSHIGNESEKAPAPRTPEVTSLSLSLSLELTSNWHGRLFSTVLSPSMVLLCSTASFLASRTVFDSRHLHYPSSLQTPLNRDTESC